MSTRSRSLLLATTSLTAGNGGIARVARMMARVVAESLRTRGEAAEALAFLDRESAGDLGLPVSPLRGSRARFVFELNRKGLTASRVLYDFPGLARAHALLRKLRRPYGTWIHGVEIWEGAADGRLDAARNADLLLCNSHYTLARASRLHGGFERAKVCWLATESDHAPTAAQDTNGPPTALIVGRIDESRYKGHDEVLDAWPAIVDAVPDARLVVVGGGPLVKDFRKRAALSPVASHIDVRGFVPEAEMDRIWRSATVFAMPSRNEGFGLVYVEAMRQALPVIASVHDAAAEVNVDGVTGYNVGLDHKDELASRLVALLTDRDRARAMGEAGRARWRQHFRFSAFRDRFLAAAKCFLEGAN